MILGKKKTVLDITPKEAELSKGNGSDNNGGKKQSDACIWGNKGNALVESSMYAEAIKCYDKAIEINPKSMEAWNNKGLALARTGRLAEAVQCYDKALELNPGDAEVIYNKGIALALLGKSTEAIECYDKILAINPGDADAWCSRGDVLFESGKFEEALAAYDKSIAIYPKDETAWNNRGMALVKLNRLSDAIESYDKALEVNPKVEKIWSNKGLAIAKLEENNNRIDLRKVAASLPKEDISTGAGLQPVLPLKEEAIEHVSVPVQPVERANTAPVDIPAVIGNTDLNNLPVANDANKAVDTQKDIPLQQVDKTVSVNEAPAEGTVMPAKQEPENIVPVEDAANLTADRVSGTQKMEPDTLAPVCDTGPVTAGVSSLPGQTEIKPDKQKTEPELFIEKAESIASDKIADIEKYLLSLPVDKTAPAVETALSGGQGTHAAAPGSGQPGDKATPVTTDTSTGIGNIDAIERPHAIEILPVNGEKVFPSADAPVSVQNPADKAGCADIDKATPAGKCVVSVPVDAYITVPFINDHLQGMAGADPGGLESIIEQHAEGTNPVHGDKTGHKTGDKITHFGESPHPEQAGADYDMEKLEPGSFIEKPYSIGAGKVKKSEEYLVMGNTLYSLGKYEDAIESYNKSLHMDNGNNTAWNNKGLALGKAGKFDEAIECYNKALDISPTDYIVLNNKGSVLYKKGRYEDALQCYRLSLELKPDSKTAKQGIRICMASLNKPGKTKGSA